MERELKESKSEWKIAFFHHPIYSSGKKHGPDLSLRSMLELIFVGNGVDLVLTGHEHFYERFVPQNGIAYIISGSSAKLRRGGIRKGSETAKGYDQGLQFLIAAIRGDDLYFQAINQSGETVDSGIIRHRERGGVDEGKGEVEVVSPIPAPVAAAAPAAKPEADAAATPQAAKPEAPKASDGK